MKPKPNFLSKKSKIKGVVETLENSINIKCFYSNKYKVYNFQSVENEITDQTITTRNGKAYVNFCQDTVTKINNEASESTLIYTKDVNTFTRYTGTLDVPDKKNVPINSWSNWTETENDETKLEFWLLLQ